MEEEIERIKYKNRIKLMEDSKWKIKETWLKCKHFDFDFNSLFHKGGLSSLRSFDPKTNQRLTFILGKQLE